ncbi:hypothetical protein [Flavobacterium sp. 7A]|uniref:hypothetical protein n=1 Tax=Flavobacterium sp. 7A TaxID=2940571 RepID=UPI0022274B55|nr:hypothetical protein [Flavobacterium sp. 7A]MCW2120603.1 hypothetical protein [Flavobacterium sp. 7A]
MYYPYAKYSEIIERYLDNSLIDLEPIKIPVKKKFKFPYEPYCISLIFFSLSLFLFYYYYKILIITILVVIGILYLFLAFTETKDIIKKYLIERKSFNKIEQEIIKENSRRRRELAFLKFENKIKEYKQNKIKVHSQLYNQPYFKIINTKKGYSESFFLYFLHHFFGEEIKPHRIIKSYENYYDYTPDFVFQNNNICIDIEIDEPYSLSEKKPIHCMDEYNDGYRDDFFTRNNWCVIRFSEEQIILYPRECCKYVADIIYKITLEYKYLDKLKLVPNLKIQKRWTTQEAELMINDRFRENLFLKAYSNASILELYPKNYFDNVNEYIVTKIGDWLTDYHLFYNNCYYGPKNIICEKKFYPNLNIGDSFKINFNEFTVEIYRKLINSEDEYEFQSEIIRIIPLAGASSNNFKV